MSLYLKYRPSDFTNLVWQSFVKDTLQKAIETHKKALEKHPEDLELYFSLENAYIQSGERSRIAELREKTSEIFIKTPELEKSLQVFYNRQKMKEDVLKK